MNCLETTLPLPRTNRAKGTVRLPELVACCTAALCLPLYLNACQQRCSHTCARMRPSSLYQMLACPCMHAHIHIHTHDFTSYNTSKEFASTTNSICLHNHRHLPRQPMVFANKIKGICLHIQRYLPPQPKTCAFTIEGICLYHSCCPHTYIYTLSRLACSNGTCYTNRKAHLPTHLKLD